jgi:hypothetical protein
MDAPSLSGGRLMLKKLFLKNMKANFRLLLVLGVTLFEIFLNFGKTTPDSILYVIFSLFFIGRRFYFSYLDIVATRPMVPLLASPLILVLENAYMSIASINSFFWTAGTLIAYKVGRILLKDEDLATLVALSYAMSPTLLMYGAGVMTDSAGFFFIGLAVYLSLKREQNESVASRIYFLDGLIVSLGVLFRETVLFGLIFMLVRRLWKKNGYTETLLAALAVGGLEFLFLSTLGFDTEILIKKLLWQRYARTRVWGVLPYLSSLGRAFGTSTPTPTFYLLSFNLWIWIMGILFLAASTVVGFIFSLERKKLLIILLFLSPSSFMWPIMMNRFSFCMWPAVIPAMISGMNTVFSRLFSTLKISHWTSKFCMYIALFILGAVNTIDQWILG